MIARLALLLCLLTLVAPPAAVAQDSPFAPLPPAQTQAQAPAQPANTSDNGNGGLKGWQETLIFIAGGVLLLGIGLAIVKDARGRAPVEESVGVHEAREQREEDHRRRKDAARARNKRAKQARRRNRPQRS